MLRRQPEKAADAAPATAGPIWLELTGMGGEKMLVQAESIVHLIEYRSGTFIQTLPSGRSTGLKVQETRDEIARKLREAGATLA